MASNSLWKEVNGVGNVLTQISNNVTNIDAICYPDDILRSSEYANSYTAFYISLHKEDQVYGETLADGERYTNAKKGAMQMANKTYSGYNVSSSVATVGGTVGAVATGRAILSSQGISSSNVVKDLVTTGFTLTAAVGSMGENNLEYRQQKAFIVLPTPALTSNYSLQWEQEPMPLAAGVAEGIASVVKGDSQAPKGFQTLSALLKNSNDAMSAVGLGLIPEVKGFASRRSGMAVNPRKEQLFKDVNFREFTFTYTFAPRSPKEATNVNSIIRQFKLHAHPSLRHDGGNFLYNYPSEFDIVHYFNDKPNPNLPRHATSVLKNISVNYAPNGHFNVNADGFPSQIQLTLQFEEIALLTKDDFDTVGNTY